MFEIIDQAHEDGAVIKVIGVGGCGGNAVEHMIDRGLSGVEFICANTDAQALKRSTARTQLQLGSTLTRGLGAGAKPEIGRDAAMEDRDRIAEMIDRRRHAVHHRRHGRRHRHRRGARHRRHREEPWASSPSRSSRGRSASRASASASRSAGIEELGKKVDSLIVIPNDKLIEVLGEDIPLLDAYAAANDVLHGAVSGIAEVINNPGLVNVDFADVRTVMGEVGMAMMGSATASGTGPRAQGRAPSRRCAARCSRT